MTTYTQTQEGCHPAKLCRLYVAGYVCGYRITKMCVTCELEEIQTAGVKCRRITVSSAEVLMTAVVIAMILGPSPSKLGGSEFIVWYSWLLLLIMHCASGHLEYWGLTTTGGTILAVRSKQSTRIVTETRTGRLKFERSMRCTGLVLYYMLWVAPCIMLCTVFSIWKEQCYTRGYALVDITPSPQLGDNRMVLQGLS